MLYGMAGQFADPRLNRRVLAVAAAFLAGSAGLADGSHDAGDGMRAAIKRYCPGPAAEKRFESHVRHADMQYVISGGETIQTTPCAGLPVIKDELSANDTRFHAEPAGDRVVDFILLPGDFLLLLPEDAHKPECFCGFSEGRKAVVKIPMDILLTNAHGQSKR